MRNVLTILALVCWFLLVCGLALTRQWAAVVPMLALGGLFEVLTHGTQKQ